MLKKFRFSCNSEIYMHSFYVLVKQIRSLSKRKFSISTKLNKINYLRRLSTKHTKLNYFPCSKVSILLILFLIQVLYRGSSPEPSGKKEVQFYVHQLCNWRVKRRTYISWFQTHSFWASLLGKWSNNGPVIQSKFKTNPIRRPMY